MHHPLISSLISSCQDSQQQYTDKELNFAVLLQVMHAQYQRVETDHQYWCDSSLC